MKAALLLGAILLISLVMANDQKGKEPPDTESKSSSGKNLREMTTKQTPTTASTGTMVYGGQVFFLLPLMWMVVHLLHM